MKSERAFGQIQARYLFGLFYTYLVASVEVIVILRIIAGPRVHVVAALALSLIAAIVGCGLTVARLSSQTGEGMEAWYDWLRAARKPPGRSPRSDPPRHKRP